MPTDLKHTKRAIMSESLLRKRMKNGTCQVDDGGELEKRCSRCKEYWPADTEFFYSASTKDGLNGWCKACCIEYRYPEGRGSVGHQFGVRKVKGDHHA